MRSVALVAASLAACAPNIGFRDHDPIGFHFLHAKTDRLVDGPYAAGSNLNVWVVGNQSFSEKFRVEVADPEAFVVERQDVRDAEIQLVGQVFASTELRVVRRSNGNVVTELPLEAVEPVALSVHSQALVRAGLVEPIDDLRLLAYTRDATVTVRLHDADGMRLFGDGGLTIGSSDRELGLFSLEGHDEVDQGPYVKVDTRAPGVSWVTLNRLGSAFATVPFEVVEEAAVASVELVSDVTEVSDGDVVTVAAVARDSERAVVVGVAPAWTLDGIDSNGVGDLFSYTRQAGVLTTLVATTGSVEGSTEIQGSAGGPSPSSATSSCSTSSARPVLVWMCLVGVFARRRRTRISLAAG